MERHTRQLIPRCGVLVACSFLQDSMIPTLMDRLGVWDQTELCEVLTGTRKPSLPPKEQTDEEGPVEPEPEVRISSTPQLDFKARASMLRDRQQQQQQQLESLLAAQQELAGEASGSAPPQPQELGDQNGQEGTVGEEGHAAADGTLAPQTPPADAAGVTGGSGRRAEGGGGGRRSGSPRSPRVTHRAMPTPPQRRPSRRSVSPTPLRPVAAAPRSPPALGASVGRDASPTSPPLVSTSTWSQVPQQRGGGTPGSPGVVTAPAAGAAAAGFGMLRAGSGAVPLALGGGSSPPRSRSPPVLHEHAPR